MLVRSDVVGLEGERCVVGVWVVGCRRCCSSFWVVLLVELVGVQETVNSTSAARSVTASSLQSLPLKSVLGKVVRVLR